MYYCLCACLCVHVACSEPSLTDNMLMVDVRSAQESRKRGRTGDGDGDTAVPSKKAHLESAAISGLSSQVPDPVVEEADGRQTKQGLVKDRLFSFKVGGSVGLALV